MSLGNSYSASLVSDLYSANFFNDSTFIDVAGQSSKYDVPVLTYIYDSSSTATDDGLTVIQPNGITTGRWLLKSRLNPGTGMSYNSSNGVIANTIPDQTVTISSGSGISTTGTYPNFTVTNTSMYVAPSFNSSPGRTLSTNGSNNTFTISTTKNAIVTYTINFSAALTLTTSNGKVTLDYSLDAGSNWIPVSSVSQVFGTSITINTNQDSVLHGVIPANALVRINRTSNTNVTVTLSSSQQEITY